MASQPAKSPKDRPWLMRTYAGHSTAHASNKLFRTNLAKGQTGLSVAFDLPTQTGYDSDHPLAAGEVGKVGVPVCHREDLAALFDELPLAQMNTSMTINATAPWLLALYLVEATRQKVDPAALAGTTQNDLIKEYLSRGTYIFPPRPSMRLTIDLIAYAVEHLPRWNPINICSYHLQEAGATPEQELAYAIGAAIAVLDELKSTGKLDAEKFPEAVGRISFFVNAGLRFVEELCKMRAFVALWDRLCRERYKISNARLRQFRYGVQVNSLGLTAQQPENNIARIIYEMLAATLCKEARARAIQLPAWNEALGLPRPWDQQLSLRLQQILAYETDLLEYDDLFSGSKVVEAKTRDLIDSAEAEIARLFEMGGPLAAVESGYIKSQLVASHAAWLASINSGERQVVGVNCFEQSEPSPLLKDLAAAVVRPEAVQEQQQIARLRVFRAARDGGKVASALRVLKNIAVSEENLMPASIAAAQVGATTGEWADTLREVFGEYRAPTGIGVQTHSGNSAQLEQLRAAVEKASRRLGHQPRVLLAKPGLDGHSNGVEQLALRARDAGMEVVYLGIRMSCEQIVATAEQEDVDLIGVSILSGAHMQTVPRLLQLLQARGMTKLPVVLGGIIPADDKQRLLKSGIAKVFPSAAHNLDAIIGELAKIIADHANGNSIYR